MGSKRTLQTIGMGVFVAGLVTLAASTLITGGFLRGLFQGMTIGLMVCAAYLFGAQWRHGKHQDGAANSEAMWLPSQDDDRE